MELRSRLSFTIILALALNMMFIGQSFAVDSSTGGAINPCKMNYFHVLGGDASGGPLLTPGDYILWTAAAYAAQYVDPDSHRFSTYAPCENWIWKSQPVTLKADGKYLVEGSELGVGFTTSIPPMETLESYPTMAKVWHVNHYDREHGFAYFFQGPLGQGGVGQGGVLTAPHGAEYEILDQGMGKAVDDTNTLLDRTNIFSTADAKACSWIRIGPHTRSHTVKYAFFAPNGALYYDYTSTSKDESWAWWTYWSYIDINGHDAANMPGNWRVDTYIDGQYIGAMQFTIQ